MQNKWPAYSQIDISRPSAGLKEVVVTRKAGEAVLRGAEVYVPGVLAVTQGVVAGDPVAVSIAREVPGALSPMRSLTRKTARGTGKNCVVAAQ